MKIGITGHQEREGINWPWVKDKINAYVGRHALLEGYSSLAAGSDQIFIKCVLAREGVSVAIIPMDNYRECFEKSAVRSYDRLLAKSKVVNLHYDGSDEQAFLNAGKWIAKHADRMVAIWDGEPAEGKGGTADIVSYAVSIGKPVHHIDPIQRIIIDL